MKVRLDKMKNKLFTALSILAVSCSVCMSKTARVCYEEPRKAVRPDPRNYLYGPNAAAFSYKH